MLNIVALQGRITADAELKTTTSGIDVLSFCIAVQRDKDKTDFIDCVAWRETAKFISKYFKKGQSIIIKGQLQTRQFEAKDGTKRKAVEVNADKAEFCGDKEKIMPIIYDKTAGTEELAPEDELPF